MSEKVIKLPLVVTPEVDRILEGQSRIQNWMYNHLLDHANKLKKEFLNTRDEKIANIIYTKRGLRNLIPELKKEYPFLMSVHSSPLKNAALRLSSSIQDYQKCKKGRRKGEETGWPKFRSVKSKFFSLLYDEPNKGFKIDGRELTVSLGVDKSGKRLKVKVLLKKSLNSFGELDVKNLRIVKQNGKYSVCICVTRKILPPKEIKKVASIDPNHVNLGHLVSTDGQSIEIENAYFLKTLQRQIDSIKSRRDRCKRKSKQVKKSNGKSQYIPSRRWIFFNNKLDRLYNLRREQTKVFLYTVAGKIYSKFDLVSVGDYTPKGGGLNRKMRRSMNNESLIGRFKSTLKWVAERDGKHYCEWNEMFSTKTCSSCGHILETALTPNKRSWICPECKVTHLRDENASVNGLKRTLKKMVPCSGLSLNIDNLERCAWKFTGLGVVERSYRGPVTVAA